MKILPLLRLVRLPNVFTAIADVLMGFFFVHLGVQPTWALAMLIAASATMYMAGMVLNDWFDLEVDRELRPERPIPSGQVSKRSAGLIGVALLLVGVGLAIALCIRTDTEQPLRWRPATVAMALAVCIVLYDSILKRTAIAPLVMGACRALNVLLGMSFAATSGAAPLGSLPLGFDGSQWAVAGGIGIYVAGITWFARDEALASSKMNLVWGATVMACGLALLGCFHKFGEFATGDRQLTFRLDIIWPLSVALLGFSTMRRCFAAINRPSPKSIQVAVKQCILSLIVFDAAVTMAACPGLVWPVVVLVLMIPFLTLGKWIRST